MFSLTLMKTKQTPAEMQPDGIFVSPGDKDPYELTWIYSPQKSQESKCQFEPLNVHKLPHSNGNLINFPNTFTSELILKQFSVLQH